jgi:hypothetical protein
MLDNIPTGLYSVIRDEHADWLESSHSLTRRNAVPWQHQHPEQTAEPRFGSQQRLRVVTRGANGQPRTYRLATSSTQTIAYRRLALSILGLDVATLAAELRSARNASPARITSRSVGTSAA